MSPTGTNDSGSNGSGISARSSAISRRHVLQLFGIAGVGAAGIGSLTACSPSTPNSDNEGGGSSGNKEFHGAYPYQLPPKGHFNLAAGVLDGVQQLSPYLDLIYPSGAMYYWADKKYEYMMAESSSLDEANKTYTMKLRSGLTWSDGSPVTAKDVVSTFNLHWLMRQQSWTFLSDVKAQDDTTVVFTIGTPSTVLERYILRAPILPESVYKEWSSKAEALRKAKASLDSGEGKKLNGDFQKFRPENPVVSGPFNYDPKTMTNSQMSLVKNDKGLFADKIGFSKVVLYNGETSDITPVVMNKDVDYATHGFAVASEKTFQSNGFRILRPPVYSGPALYLNYTTHPEFSDVRVRQAIAYVLDRNENGTVALGDSGKPCKFMAGFSDITVPDWVSDADQKKLNAYEKDLDKATQLLQAAGWKKSGDKWTLPNGKPAAYDIKFPTEFADWNPAATNAADQLNKFGFNITKRGVTFTQQEPDVLAGKFDIAIQAWGASSHPHPYFSYVQDLYRFNYVLAANQGGKGMNFPLEQTTSAGPIDLKSVVDKSAQGLNLDEQKKNITAAALAFNELLPIIPLWERYGNNPALEGSRVAKFPADDDPILKNAPYADNFVIMGLYAGKITPA
ncbi:ABC transporter substrate-binding protein [Kribbella sp. NPDC023972]|uniref:ABC transporter substrate-binding protein n=1 Tax=Kribbella sp. NPDC023972 TaxID=3154795 RepID=UPI0033DA2D6B